MKAFINKYKHAGVLLYGFIYQPWFAHLEKTVTKYHIIHVALDDYIPFNEYFVIPYFFWFIYVAGAMIYFFFVSRKDFYKLSTFLFTGMTISLIICTIFPNGTDFRPAINPDKNIFTHIVAWLYSTDTCTNVLPSIHVYNSIGVHIAVLQSETLKKHRGVRIFSGFAMTAICLSTVFLKQHSVVDGLASITMAYCMYGLVYGQAYMYNRRKAAEKALG